jgi:hypothetical protein
MTMTTTAMRTRISAYSSCIRFPARNVMLPVADRVVAQADDAHPCLFAAGHGLAELVVAVADLDAEVVQADMPS